MTDPIARLEALGRQGITVSVACGPCGLEAFRWTVQAMANDGRAFARPYAATSFEHAVAIAELEALRRGWT